MQSPDHPELVFVQARYFSVGRPDGPPLWIVVHDMEAGEYSGRAESTAEYFRTMTDGRTVSSHYTADDDSVVQCVLLKDTAYTVGNRPGNYRGINWEFSGFARQTRAEWLDAFGLAMFRQAAPIIRADAARFGIPLRRCTVPDLQARRPGITSHNDLRLAFGGTTHTDPGPNFPWDTFLSIINEEGDMLSDKDAQHLIWRVESLVADKTTYTGGPQLGQAVPFVVRSRADSATLDALHQLVVKIAERVDIDPEELAAIQAAAKAGAESAAEAIVAGVLAGLPEQALTKADVESALRTVLGSLDA